MAKTTILGNLRVIDVERYDALGYMKPNCSCGDTMRWLDHDTEIEFTAVNEQNDFNYEFVINGNPNHLIWFSQISGFHLNPDNVKQIATPVIVWKDGSHNYVYTLKPSEFWQKVQGKRFKVTVDGNYPIMIDKKNPTVKKFNTLEAITDYIAKNLRNKNYGAIVGMTKAAKTYLFEEI